jgi:hypothetical protein
MSVQEAVAAIRGRSEFQLTLKSSCTPSWIWDSNASFMACCSASSLAADATMAAAAGDSPDAASRSTAIPDKMRRDAMASEAQKQKGDAGKLDESRCSSRTAKYQDGPNVERMPLRAGSLCSMFVCRATSLSVIPRNLPLRARLQQVPGLSSTVHILLAVTGRQRGWQPGRRTRTRCHEGGCGGKGRWR